MLSSHSSPISAHPKILVVDDEPDLLTLYELSLLREGYQVSTAENLAQARICLQAQRFDLLITDMRLPDGQGMELLHELHAQQRTERSIVITAHGSAQSAVQALRYGAFDYLTKPVDIKQFRQVVASALGRSALAAAATASPSTSTDPSAPAAGVSPSPSAQPPCHSALLGMAGQSSTMQAVRQRIQKVAPSMAPVLIYGESGTGKELVARALHACSHRAQGPLIAVNCGAIPESLLEAEFFGVRKGAYTGAQHDRPGFFQAANGGTLFLDELGELPLSMQAKLLRAVQERRVRPLGATQEELVDVRIISATHRDLAAEVQQGRFRQDLYYRLNVIDMQLPPLRQRREDLPALCQHLLNAIAEPEQPPLHPTPALLERLAKLPLYGNVRELENLLYRYQTLGLEGVQLPDSTEAQDPSPPGSSHQTGESDQNTLSDLNSPAATATPWQTDSESLPQDLQAWLDAQERRVLIQALQAYGYNRTAAAARMGLNLRQIRYRIERLGIPIPTGDA